MTKNLCLSVSLALLFGSSCWGQVTPATPGWFKFELPGLAVPADGVVDLSHLNSVPITGPGFVSVRDGHFVDAAGDRLRMFGTNLTGDSCFPDQHQASGLARRLRQYGFNCLRLHFMDFSWGDATRDSLWADASTGKLSEPSLAKLDRLIAECAANGIYLNLNLHVGREYPDQPNVDGARSFRYSKNLDRWYDPYVEQMETFCRDLLNHVNSQTGRRYADEPAIACVEINNENTMIRDDLAELRRLPGPMRRTLEQKWTAWLRKRHGTTEQLRRHWNADVIPLGEEALVDSAAWRVQNSGGAVSSLTQNGGHLIWDATAAGDESWNLQLQYKNLQLEPGRYTLSLRARSRDSKTIGINLMLDADPWDSVGLDHMVKLDSQWQTITATGLVNLPIHPSGTPPLRMNISLRNETGNVEFDEISLRPGGGEGLPDDQSLEAGVGLPSPTVVSAVRLDWMQFLIDTEMATTRRLVNLLKNEIGCQMPIADTQVSYGGVAGVLRESRLSDYVDIHGYWQHPHYQRDSRGRVTAFRIPNSSQVAATDGGTLAKIGVYRIADRPLSVSEYNTPAPNDHGAELFPLFAAIAGLQDWDAFYSYTYRDFGKEYEDTFIRKYFHLIGRSNVLVHAPAASLAFRKAMIRASSEETSCQIPAGMVTSLAEQTGGVDDVWRALGGDTAVTWLRKTNVRLTDTGNAPVLNGNTEVPAGVRQSDTKQIVWVPEDPLGPWLSLNAPSVRFLIGHVGGRSFDVGDISIRVHPRPWPNELPAYACISMVALDGKPLQDSRQMLLAASARTENTAMDWNVDRTSLDNDGWGRPPTLSEAVPLDLTVPGKKVQAWRVTPLGQRGEALPMQENVLRLRDQHQTLWVLLTRP